MKAENEEKPNGIKNTDVEKDKLLSQTINDGFQEDGLSSNFTHLVMGKIEQLENSAKRKPLVSWWAWIIIGGLFGAAVILAITNAKLPDQPVFELDDKVYETYSEYSSYVLAAMGAMALILIDRIIDYRKRFSS